jgi:hypothetical protein
MAHEDRVDDIVGALTSMPTAAGVPILINRGKYFSFSRYAVL